MDNETLKKILDLAVLAPSGDNVQPWRFDMRDGKLLTFNIPERDDSLYNFQSLAGYLNHGTLLENISIVSPSFGYTASFDFFPQKTDPNLVASVCFEKTETKEHPLFTAITSRHTNRKPYDSKPLSREELAELTAVVKEGNAKVFFTADEKQKKRIGNAASKNEIALFGNSKLHSFFFNHIHWVPEKGDETGFPVETLEIPKEAFPVFRALRSWKVSRALSALKISYLIAAQNAKLYASAGAHGAIVFEDFSPRASVLSGMIFERLWLQAAKMGLKFQPLMGVAFLMESVRAGNTALSEIHGKIIKNAYSEMESSFGVSNGVITAAFRIGRGTEPSGKTKRLPPEIKFY
jgi:nitroreductase